MGRTAFNRMTMNSNSFNASLPSRRVWPRLCAGLLCFVLIGLLGGCGKAPEAKPQLAEGFPFPPLTLNYSEGKALSTQSFQGKLLVLNVWATWCPPCRREMPSLERLSRTLDPKRFAVIGLSTDADANLASEFLLQNGITFANFFDQNGKIARDLGLQVYPETFLIGPDGRLVERIAGLREWDSPEMMARLESAYQGKLNVAKYFTK